MSAVPHRFATNCVHAGQVPDPTTGAIMTPIYMTSTYVQKSPGVFIDDYDYARSKNPTRTALEANLAALEGADFGLTFSSGLAAMDCVLHQLHAGDHVVLVTVSAREASVTAAKKAFDAVLASLQF